MKAGCGRVQILPHRGFGVVFQYRICQVVAVAGAVQVPKELRDGFDLGDIGSVLPTRYAVLFLDAFEECISCIGIELFEVFPESLVVPDPGRRVKKSFIDRVSD